MYASLEEKRHHLGVPKRGWQSLIPSPQVSPKAPRVSPWEQPVVPSIASSEDQLPPLPSHDPKVLMGL